MDEEHLLELIAKARKDIKRAMVLTGLAVAVAIAVLAIDNGIKRAIVEEAQQARVLLGQTRDLLEVHGERAEAAGEGGDPAGPGLNGSDDLVHAPPPGEVLAEAQRPAAAARPVVKGGPKRGAAGNGRGTEGA